MDTAPIRMFDHKGRPIAPFGLMTDNENGIYRDILDNRFDVSFDAIAHGEVIHDGTIGHVGVTLHIADGVFWIVGYGDRDRSTGAYDETFEVVGTTEQASEVIEAVVRLVTRETVELDRQEAWIDAWHMEDEAYDVTIERGAR